MTWPWTTMNTTILPILTTRTKYGYDNDLTGASNIHRFLAPAGGAPTVDYSVISIIVITLGIVLAVEVLRHQLDVAASGNPFFHNVLELMYRELTTLGIVEFCIYLMHKYDEDFNYQMEAMFVDVHFMLFYTAVFNALQSCLVRIWTSHLTDRVWVQTEDMDIRHYVALRREYDRLEKKMLNYNPSSHSEISNSDTAQESESTSVWMSLQQALRDLAFKIRHPYQSRRMYQLMLPIRFHALRAHFIDSYKLPPRFKVSDYLKRSLTSVLLDFVHISSAAWIMLMATANLLWFVSGILLYKSKKSLEVEEFLVSIFIAMMVLFVLFAFVLFFKMKSIFSNIMTMKLTTFDSENEVQKSWGDGARRVSERTTKTLDQLKLFWGRNPHLIIVATQYMQFGYALGFAMIFTYYKDFKEMYHIVSPGALLVALLASYLIFLKLVSVIIPQYTICTSIGQLANKDRLNETLAKLQLTEEIRKKETREEVRKAEEEIARRKEEIEAKNAEVAARVNETPKPPYLSIKDPKFAFKESDRTRMFKNRTSDPSDPGPRRNWRRHARKKSASDGIQLMSMSAPSFETRTSEQTKGSAGTTSGSQVEEANSPIEVEGHPNTRLKQITQKSVSDDAHFISITDPHHGNLLCHSSALPTKQISAAAAQQRHIVDENEPHLHETHVNSSSQAQPDSRRNILSVKSMNLIDSSTLGHPSDKPIPAQCSPSNTSVRAMARQIEEKDCVSVLSIRAGPTVNVISSDDTNVGNTMKSVKDDARKQDVKGVSKMHHIHETDVVKGPLNLCTQPKLSMGKSEQTQRRCLLKTQSDDVSSMRVSLPTKSAGFEATKEKEPEKCTSLSEHAHISTKDFEIPDFPQRVKPKRRPRTRAFSEGVSSMSVGPAVNPFSVDDTAIRASTKGLGDYAPRQEKAEPKMGHIGEIDAANGGDYLSSKVSADPNPSLGRGEMRKHRRRLMKTQSDGVSLMRSTLSKELTKFDAMKDKEPEKLATLSELAHISTDDLPEIPEFPQKVRPKRRPRTRAFSEGVSSMRTGPTVSKFSVDDTVVGVATKVSEDQEKAVSTMRQIGNVVNGGHHGPLKMLTDPKSSPRRDRREQRRRLMKTQSDGVSFMGSSFRKNKPSLLLDSIEEREPEKLAIISSLAHISNTDLPEPSDPDFSHRVRSKTRSRTRASSEGVSLMGARLIDNMRPSDATKLPTAVANSAKEPQELGGSTPMEPANRKVTFSSGKNNNLSPSQMGVGIKDEMADDASFDSSVSENGDFDVVLDVAHHSRLQTIKQKIDLAAFFTGPQYRILSLIFGPMACFFFVAMRVEIFNIYAGTFVDQTNIWKYMLAPCFWVEVSLYCLMIVEMISVIIVFSTKRGREGTLLSCFAAMFGLLINVMCLLLLLIAEMKRCCHDDDNIFIRLLAGQYPSKGYDNPSEEYVECCPKFGERRYGGLGKIEPFTCLIALSPLRFIVAGYAVRLVGKASSHDEDTNTTHEHHHGLDPTAKVREIWMTAIGVHSDIAKLFGPFSGELLQCMLGIYSSETSHFPTSPSLLEATSQLTIGDPASSSANNETTEHDYQHHEGDNSSKAGITNPSTSPAIERHEYFEYPEAPLIRRMRRCEMRLLPLLNDEWMLVDVVITRHELILFDIGDEADVCQSPNALSTNNKTGGKFFSLRDVAQGRAIIGQFDLDDVDFLDIEHRAAVPDVVYDEDVENRTNLLEYWEGGDDLNGDYDANAMNKRWGSVDEDRLKIHFKDKQTLYLRFMVDLKEMEHKRKALADDPIIMNHIGTHMKLWCSCIAKIRGPMNLKQDLPRFGNKDTSEMLEDFIEICDRDGGSSHPSAEKLRKKFHKRNFSSFNNLDASGKMATFT